MVSLVSGLFLTLCAFSAGQHYAQRRRDHARLRRMRQLRIVESL